MTELGSDLLFLFERLTWQSALDILLVTGIIFAVLILVRDTQAMLLLRGVIFFILMLSVLTTVVNLPAFSWLLKIVMPSLLLVIPVIFAPEIRRALERLGRASTGTMFRHSTLEEAQVIQESIRSIVSATARLSARQHGALIVMQRSDSLLEYIETGVLLQAKVTPEVLLQIFYPNTPLHDGAVIIADGRVEAASCVMPLSASGILNRSPERQMGLRHRASLGTSEATDAIVVVVSEETGNISIAHSGKMIRRLDSERLENVLLAFHRAPEVGSKPLVFLRKIVGFITNQGRGNQE
ncbi:MAG: TIGR00159 family protein [Anaerolineaceae bacterium]|nr:TIGR00159 family protein [Anaerolineaceae bacterium]